MSHQRDKEFICAPLVFLLKCTMGYMGGQYYYDEYFGDARKDLEKDT